MENIWNNYFRRILKEICRYCKEGSKIIGGFVRKISFQKFYIFPIFYSTLWQLLTLIFYKLFNNFLIFIFNVLPTLIPKTFHEVLNFPKILQLPVLFTPVNRGRNLCNTPATICILFFFSGRYLVFRCGCKLEAAHWMRDLCGPWHHLAGTKCHVH